MLIGYLSGGRAGESCNRREAIMRRISALATNGASRPVVGGAGSNPETGDKEILGVGREDGLAPTREAVDTTAGRHGGVERRTRGTVTEESTGRIRGPWDRTRSSTVPTGAPA